MQVENGAKIVSLLENLRLSLTRVYSDGEFPGLKTTVFDHIGLLSPQICTDLRGVKNPWKIGGNPPIGEKKYTLLGAFKTVTKSVIKRNFNQVRYTSVCPTYWSTSCLYLYWSQGGQKSVDNWRKSAYRRKRIHPFDTDVWWIWHQSKLKALCNTI